MTSPRFMVCALPRSRTAWMAKFLAYGGRVVAHDLAAYSDTVDHFLNAFGPSTMAGVVETGAVIGWELVARAWPDTRFVVVRRDPDEVQGSLAKFGLTLDPDDLATRMAAMDELASRPGTLVLNYRSLSHPVTCAGLFEHCLGVPFDWQWWRTLADENVQADMPKRIAHLTTRRNSGLALRQEVAERLAAPRPFEWIGWQPWRDVAADVAALGVAHYQEAEDISRTYHPNLALLNSSADAGALLVACARVDGGLVGYCTWTPEPDTEANGHTVMNQGAWYCRPDHRLGVRILKWSMDQFRANGVSHFRLHHTMRGRGARLAPIFKRLGAVEYKREYDLNLGSR